MDADGRLRRALAAFGGGDVWDLVDTALATAEPADLRARRDGIVERLYAGTRCRNCDVPEYPPQPPRQPAEALSPTWQENEEEADVDVLGQDEETDEGSGLEGKILAIRDFLEDPDQSEEELVSLLQNLADMDMTYKALQETDIGRHVNGLRKHPSGNVRQLVKLLVRKWKEIVDGWVRLHNCDGDGGSSILTDGDSPEKTQGKSYQNAQVSDFKYTPSPPKRHNGSGSEWSRNNSGFESTQERRRASPAPTYHHAKQNNGNNYSTTSSSAPSRALREQKDNHLDEKLDSARKRLQENYQEAQNAKKQRTMQVLDIHDLPKPKNRNTFIRKGGGGGLPGRR